MIDRDYAVREIEETLWGMPSGLSHRQQAEILVDKTIELLEPAQRAVDDVLGSQMRPTSAADAAKVRALRDLAMKKPRT